MTAGYYYPGGYVSLQDGNHMKFNTMIADHLGNTRMVLSQTNYDGQHQVEQRTNYYAFGGPLTDGSIGADVQTHKFIGKELDTMHGLNMYDFGARQLDPTTGLFTSMDPLCEKYYNISPYSYCAGNPIRYVDPDGRRIKPNGEEELDMIKMTLPEEARDYVSLDENGYIDSKLMDNHYCGSGNYHSLLRLVNSELDYFVSLDDNYSYKNSEGDVITQYMEYQGADDMFMDKDCISPSGNSTGEIGELGITLLPFDKMYNKNSTDNINRIVIHKSLSDIGRAETFTHEAYGHAYLYDITKNREISKHKYNLVHDENEVLTQRIIDRRKETLNNIAR